MIKNKVLDIKLIFNIFKNIKNISNCQKKIYFMFSKTFIKNYFLKLF